MAAVNFIGRVALRRNILISSATKSFVSATVPKVCSRSIVSNTANGWQKTERLNFKDIITKTIPSLIVGGGLFGLMAVKMAVAEKKSVQQEEDTASVFISPKTTNSLLSAKLDHYGGVIVVDATEQCNSKEEFSELLAASVKTWKAEKRRGIWLQLPSNYLEWAKIAKDNGFEIHHAEKDEITLTLWIPEDQPNTLPGYTSHTFGVGAVVINDKQEILIVQEQSGPASQEASGYEFWKYPTGLVDAGENARDAVVREVKEETGIDADVVSMVCMRESHSGANRGWMSGKTNVFIVFLLRPTSSEISTQESEIAMCKWVPIDDYMANMTKRMPVGSLYHEISKLAIEAYHNDENVFTVRDMPVGFRRGTNTLYGKAPSKL